jgi:hypothetical protein
MQCQTCRRTKHFSKYVEENIFVLKTRGIVKIYNSGVVTHDGRISSRVEYFTPGYKISYLGQKRITPKI